MAVEFPLACRQYPIIFVQSPEGVIVAQAVLSLTERSARLIIGAAFLSRGRATARLPR